MRKHLSSSSNTGKKIIKNMSLFSYSYDYKEEKEDVIYYYFKWNFDGQEGYATIIVKKGEILEESLINTYRCTPRKFNKSLSLYNDPTLGQVFKIMLDSIGVK